MNILSTDNPFLHDSEGELSLCQRVHAFCQNNSLLPESYSSPLLVGFSGGADSLTLLLILIELGQNIEAVHFHHNLRNKEADADAEWCRWFCEDQAIPFSCYLLNTPNARLSGESIEQTARRLRLQKWREITSPNQTVALGHQAEDQLENLFLRLGRGSNVSGLASLKPKTSINKVCLIRPLLEISREEIETFLNNKGIKEWRRDSTNEQNKFRRNAVRHELLPLTSRIFGGQEALFRSLQNLKADAHFIDQAVKMELKKHPVPRLSHLRHLHPALLPRLLRFYLSNQLNRDFVPRHQVIDRLRKELLKDTEKPRRMPLGQGLELHLQNDRISVIETKHPAPLEQIWNWRQNPRLKLNNYHGEGVLKAEIIPAEKVKHFKTPDKNTAYFDPKSMPAIIKIRTRTKGDKMVPFGRRNAVKIKELINSEKIPAEKREQLPILLTDETIIWIPGIRQSSFAALNIEAPPPEILVLKRVFS